MKIIRIEPSNRNGFVELQENRWLLFWKRFGDRIYTSDPEALAHLRQLFGRVKARVASDGGTIYACED